MAIFLAVVLTLAVLLHIVAILSVQCLPKIRRRGQVAHIDGKRRVN